MKTIMPYRSPTTGKFRVRSLHACAKQVLTYAVPGMSEADIRLQLMEEEDRAVEEGDVPLHRVSPAGMIIELLEIEDQQ